MEATFLQIILLGVIQGAAELLPVSSSAHVIVAEKLMHIDPSSPAMTFLLVMLHTGTMFAVIFYFWNSWKESFFSNSKATGDAAFRIGLATMLTAFIYLFLQAIIKKTLLSARPGAEVESLFSNLPLIAVSLAVAGLIIVVAGLKRVPVPASQPDGPLPPGKAMIIGVVQGFTLPFRGLSRSGSTISAGMLIGVPKRIAEEFSFALAVIVTPPAIARELLRLYKVRSAGGAPVQFGPLLVPGMVGMVFSFGAGLLALQWLSGWLENGKWHYFGFYCFAAAAFVAYLAHIGY
ncbi:MAG TPA: undecaprenyl-diphosphate phosphatase [Opitutaceae bacterium]|jgi:undecaprenyl-diphosphatase|nr:undecaprenyl-diphosphate phosphatase [Opitutaceae bacterium]